MPAQRAGSSVSSHSMTGARIIVVTLVVGRIVLAETSAAGSPHVLHSAGH